MIQHWDRVFPEFSDIDPIWTTNLHGRDYIPSIWPSPTNSAVLKPPDVNHAQNLGYKLSGGQLQCHSPVYQFPRLNKKNSRWLPGVQTQSPVLRCPILLYVHFCGRVLLAGSTGNFISLGNPIAPRFNIRRLETKANMIGYNHEKIRT